MFSVIGIVIVIGAVIGGYMMGHGNLHILFQPAELVIIWGSALGALIISSPGKVLPGIFKNIGKVFGGMPSKNQYLELLVLLSAVFGKIRKEGLVAIEQDVENPASSPLFAQAPGFLKNHHAVAFLCDNLRVIMTTNIPPHELEAVMEAEMDVHHEEALLPAQSVTAVADGLPALGIVAAVLGVVITMGKINEPPEVLGHHVGAALVGTFLGVLTAYGFVGPMAANLTHKAREDSVPLAVIKSALVSFVGGAAPQIAVEFGRRAIPGADRPDFVEMEEAIRSK